MTVSILEKVILRWCREVGFRGFQTASATMDDVGYEDILKVFRKQKVDTALDEALASVLSMAEYPEARQQYCQMLESYHPAKDEIKKHVECVGSSSTDNPDQEKEILTKVLGPDPKGRVRMMGSGVTHSMYYGNSKRVCCSDNTNRVDLQLALQRAIAAEEEARKCKEMVLVAEKKARKCNYELMKNQRMLQQVMKKLDIDQAEEGFSCDPYTTPQRDPELSPGW